MAEAVATPVEIKLGDGSVVKGANMDEAFQNLAKMKEDTAKALKEERDRLQQATEEATRLRGEVEKYKNPPKSKVEGQFDSERYYKLLNEDPVAANDYYFEYRFGRKPDEFNQDYQRISQQVSVIEQQTVAATFQARHAHEWPGGNDAARLMREKVEELTREGHPFSSRTLETAWSELVSEGKIKPVEKKEEPEEPPNPSLSGAGAGEFDLKSAETMSDKELEAALRKAGALK